MQNCWVLLELYICEYGELLSRDNNNNNENNNNLKNKLNCIRKQMDNNKNKLTHNSKHMLHNGLQFYTYYEILTNIHSNTVNNKQDRLNGRTDRQRDRQHDN